MGLSPFARTFLRWTLASVPILCVMFAGLSILATLAAGTMQMDGEYPDGPGNLLLSSISVVRFKGIVASKAETGGYELTLHWFLNAFGWEWPTSTWEKSCGIVHNMNGFFAGEPLTLPEDLALAAARFRLPKEDYRCLDKYSGRSGLCYNDFLAAWAAASPRDASFKPMISLIVYYFAGAYVLVLGIQEIAARKFPGLLKCQCPNFIKKRNWCSCLKEGEQLTPERRNSLRITVLLNLAATYIIASLTLAWEGTKLVQYLKEVDAQVGGMDPHIGTGFIVQSVSTLSAVLLVVLCLKLRSMVRMSRSMMEEQMDVEALNSKFRIVDNDEHEVEAKRDEPNKD